MEDTEIIRLYHARKEQAITESDKKYGGYCRSIARNILSAAEDARECVNDTWFAAWRQMPPALPTCLRVFLGRITRNIAISRWRRDHAARRGAGAALLLTELEECLPDTVTVEQTVDAAVLTACIERWLDTLSPEQRALFLRRYWHGESLKDLAAAVSCTPAQLAQRMYALRTSLRKTLEREELWP